MRRLLLLVLVVGCRSEVIDFPPPSFTYQVSVSPRDYTIDYTAVGNVSASLGPFPVAVTGSPLVVGRPNPGVPTSIPLRILVKSGIDSVVTVILIVPQAQ